MQAWAQNATSIKVVWEKPEVKDVQNDPVLGYQLSLHRENNDSKLLILVSEATSHVVTKLGRLSLERRIPHATKSLSVSMKYPAQLANDKAVILKCLLYYEQSTYT